MSSVRVERLTTLSQFERCVEIQKGIWKYAEGELFPRRAFLLADRIGGHVLGALSGEEMVAFTLAYPGLHGSKPYLHSQMLAVLPEFRNAGVGRALKLAQRELALAQGIDLIRWTYDPLEIKNAFFNLVRLGAVSRTYVQDFYGPSSSPLQGGLPTDRLYADWWIRSERVRARLDGAAEATDQVQATVRVPSDIEAWKGVGDPRAREAQARVGAELQAAFGMGLMVTGYVREEDKSGAYLLTTIGATEEVSSED